MDGWEADFLLIFSEQESCKLISVQISSVTFWTTLYNYSKTLHRLVRPSSTKRKIYITSSVCRNGPQQLVIRPRHIYDTATIALRVIRMLR